MLLCAVLEKLCGQNAKIFSVEKKAVPVTITVL